MQKYLIIIKNVNDIIKYKNIGINKFLYPLKNYCVGFDFDFDINEIKEENSYLLINKVLDTKEISTLNNVINNLPENISGIVFDDLGIAELLKNKNLEKIMFNNHFTTNYLSINEYLKYMDSLVVSTDIIFEDVITILNKAIKPLVLYGFGHLNLSVSKRELLKNYSEFHNIEYKDKLSIKNKNNEFLVKESGNQTVIYDKLIFNALDEFENLPNTKHIIVNTFNLDDEDVIKALLKQDVNLNFTKGFLNKKTIYKLKRDE